MMEQVIPQIHVISDASLLRKSSCNYLRSALSPGGSLVSLIVTDGIRFFSYSSDSGNLIDTFYTIRLSAGDLIRDLAWAPAGVMIGPGGAEQRQDTLAVCFEARLELWTTPSRGKSFVLHKSYPFESKIIGILHMLWDASRPDEICICSSTQVYRVLLLLPPTSEESCTQLLPGLNMRHPGGLALSSHNFVTGNAHREAVLFDGGRARGWAATGSVRRQVVQRCRPPRGLTPQQAQQLDSIKYAPSCTISHTGRGRSSGAICMLAFEPQAPIAAAPGPCLLPPTATAVAFPFSAGVHPGPSLISVVSSSSPVCATLLEDSCSALTSDLSATSAARTPAALKSKGSFPHSIFSTSISETLSVGHTRSVPPDQVEGCSALEALRSLSLSSHVTPLQAAFCAPPQQDDDSVYLMTTGFLCAVRTSSSLSDGLAMKWLGSGLSVGRGLDAGPILRPDVMATYELSDLGDDDSREHDGDDCAVSSQSGKLSFILAVASSTSDQVTVFHVRNDKECGDEVGFHEVFSFNFPSEERCKGLTFLPMRRGSSSNGSDAAVLLALAGKPKAQSVASHSTSAIYETSLFAFKLPPVEACPQRRSSVPQRKDEEMVEREKKGSMSEEERRMALENSNICVLELLHQMNANFEGRFDRLEAAMSVQGEKIERLQSCVDKLTTTGESL